MNFESDVQKYNETKIALGQKIKQLREERKLTLKELGEMIGISEGSMSKIENGHWINLNRIVDLSKILNFEITIQKK